MNIPKDVKSIMDIPRIEDYIDYLFEFEVYDVIDNLVMYTCNTEVYRVTVEIHCKETLFEKEVCLVDLINFEGIDFLQWNVYHQDIFSGEFRNNVYDEDLHCFYTYRPLVDESEKDYL